MPYIATDSVCLGEEVSVQSSYVTILSQNPIAILLTLLHFHALWQPLSPFPSNKFLLYYESYVWSHWNYIILIIFPNVLDSASHDIHSCHPLFDPFQFALIHGPNIPGSYTILLFTALDLASITSHILNCGFCFGSISLFFLELIGSDQTGDGKSECQHFRNQ